MEQTKPPGTRETNQIQQTSAILEVSWHRRALAWGEGELVRGPRPPRCPSQTAQCGMQAAVPAGSAVGSEDGRAAAATRKRKRGDPALSLE